MKSSGTLSKWQRRSVESLAVTGVVLVPIFFLLILTTAEQLIFDHPWYIACAGIAVYAVAFMAFSAWDALVLAEMHGPLIEKNTGLLGGVTDKITNAAVSLIHRRDRKRLPQ